mgnify:FL=1
MPNGDIDASRGLTADHLIPAAEGGGMGPDNLVLACQECNLARGHHWNKCDVCACGEVCIRALYWRLRWDRPSGVRKCLMICLGSRGRLKSQRVKARMRAGLARRAGDWGSLFNPPRVRV